MSRSGWRVRGTGHTYVLVLEEDVEVPHWAELRRKIICGDHAWTNQACRGDFIPDEAASFNDLRLLKFVCTNDQCAFYIPTGELIG